MLVLHAWWRAPSATDDGGLLVWAEDSAVPALAPRAGRVPRGAAHPFAADAAQLSAALVLPLDLGDRRELTLPTLRGRPEASPELPREEEEEEEERAGGTGRPAAWSVPVLELSLATALEVLLAPLADG